LRCVGIFPEAHACTKNPVSRRTRPRIETPSGMRRARIPPITKSRRTPQGDTELMAKKQVLGFKLAPRLNKSTTNISSECWTASIGPDHPKPDGIFGNDRLQLNVLSSTCWSRSRRASYPIGVARSRPRMSESQSIESSRRPCARPPLCSHGDIRTENLPSNVTGPKDLRSVTKIPQDDFSKRPQCDTCSTYRSGRTPDWLKMKNSNGPAVKREAEEDWSKERWR